MRRQSLKRIITEQPKGHIHCNPRHGSTSRPRRTNTDEDQETVEMGSKETGMGSDTSNQSSSGDNSSFPSSSKSDKSVKTHGHNNPKVDSRPVETSNEKGTSTSQRQLEGKREAGIVWIEDPRSKKGGYWKHDRGQKTDPEYTQEKAITIEDHEGLDGIRNLTEEEVSMPGYNKEIPLEYSDFLNRLQGGEDIQLKSALHLCIDERLRGSVNSIVESFDDLSWDEIESVSYQPMAAAESIEEWPTTSRDGVMIYHADTPTRQAQGLQYLDKRDFPKNAIMLFKNASGPFHMHNCRFPIDIIFTDDDFRVLAIHNMAPEGGYTYSPMGTKHAIETHPDWAENKGINEGDILFKDE